MSVTLWIFLITAVFFGFFTVAMFSENEIVAGFISGLSALGLGTLFVFGLFQEGFSLSTTLWIFFIATVFFGFFSALMFSENDGEGWGFFWSMVALGFGIAFIYGFNTDDNLIEESKPKPTTKIVKKIKPEPIPEPVFDIDDKQITKAFYLEIKQNYDEQFIEFNKIKQHNSVLEKFVNSSKQELNNYKIIMDEALAKLKKSQERVWDNPELSSEKERIIYRQAKMALEEQNNELELFATQLIQVKKDLQLKPTTLQAIKNKLSYIKQQIKERKNSFAQFKARIEAERTVDGYGEVGCPKEYSIEKCKETAKQAALRNTSEQAAVVLLDSKTWTSLDKEGKWKITKDEIRTQLKVIIIEHKVLDDGVIGKSIGYYYKIRATVKGQIPPELQQQFLAY